MVALHKFMSEEACPDCPNSLTKLTCCSKSTKPKVSRDLKDDGDSLRYISHSGRHGKADGNGDNSSRDDLHSRARSLQRVPCLLVPVALDHFAISSRRRIIGVFARKPCRAGDIGCALGINVDVTGRVPGIRVDLLDSHIRGSSDEAMQVGVIFAREDSATRRLYLQAGRPAQELFAHHQCTGMIGR